MKITPRPGRPSQFALLVLSLACVRLAVAAEPTVYIVTRPDMQCDDINRSWKVYNEHTYHSFQVTVRWHAVGAKEKEESFILAPKSSRNIGCAPEVVIVSAEEMQF